MFIDRHLDRNWKEFLSQTSTSFSYYDKVMGMPILYPLCVPAIGVGSTYCHTLARGHLETIHLVDMFGPGKLTQFISLL